MVNNFHVCAIQETTRPDEMLTSILPPTGFVQKLVGVEEARDSSFQRTQFKHAKFKTPFSLETVFLESDPPDEDLRLFVANRCGEDLSLLSEDSQSKWRKSWRENRILCGYLVIAVVFPEFLKRRIRLREAETHWVTLDVSTPKGRASLERRMACLEVVGSMTAESCYRGTSTKIRPSVLVRDFLGLPSNSDDEGVVFFKYRDFCRSPINSSAQSSCSAILSHLWFVTTILGRPASLDSVVLPVSGEESSRLSTLGICGKVSVFPVNWQDDVFPCLPGYYHDNMPGLFLERLTSDSYLDVYPCDVFLAYKSSWKSGMEGVGSRQHPAVTAGQMCSAHNLVVVPCFDTVLVNKNACDIDALDIGAISLVYGEEASRRVRKTGTVDVFLASMGKKMYDALKYFSALHSSVRRSCNNRVKVSQGKDPGGIEKKLSGGRLLDPRIRENVEAVKDMIRHVSFSTWNPIKAVVIAVTSGLSPDMNEEDLCRVFLRTTYRGKDFRERARGMGVTMVDVSNVCFLFCLTMSFQRSQVLRDSLVREYRPSRDGGCGYTLSVEREIKTTGADSNGYCPVREFELTPSQSMMVHFIKLMGNRRADEPLLVNERGSTLSQNTLGIRYKTIGRAFLGIPSLSPHAMRTFFATYAVDSGAVDGKDLNEFAAFLQVSSKTLSTSYVAASTRSESHVIGKRVMGDVMGSASNKVSRVELSRPNGKQLGSARDAFKESILRTVARYSSALTCFASLVSHRKEGCLQKMDEWFLYKNTYFSDDDAKFFVRYVSSRRK
jgi:hypothetical protein